MSYGYIEVVSFVQIIAFEKFISSDVKIVGAGLQDHICDRSAGAAKLGIVVAGGNIDGLNGFDGRNENLQKAGALVVVNSFGLLVFVHAKLAVSFCLQLTACVEKLRVLERSARGAGHNVEKILEIAICG